MTPGGSSVNVQVVNDQQPWTKQFTSLETKFLHKKACVALWLSSVVVICYLSFSIFVLSHPYQKETSKKEEVLSLKLKNTGWRSDINCPAMTLRFKK